MADEKKFLLDDMENSDRDIFGKRISVDLYPENARFSISGGGLICMTLKKSDGSEEFFERVVPVRAFPITEPDCFISIREPDTKDVGKGAEIGLIEKLSDFDNETVSIINKELEKRYFTPEILKIYNIKEQFGYLYFDVLTTAGKSSFVMNNPSSNIRVLEDKRSLIYDIDGNCFEIPEISKMDKASFKKIEIYL
ncbi:MAG: DUF1854 domain-containing protein [Clostridia bacterium]|nr:DUF1854 domain-containing protein [Clostridia bacterium]